MLSEQLQKKVDQSIKLLQTIAKQKPGVVMEIAYSGGKDSDCILLLAREAGIDHKVIHRCTTIDPPGTIAHAKAMGAEIRKPRKGMTFWKLIERNGLPSLFRRFCCSKLKEYKIMDQCVMGVRRDESSRRSKRYTEPTECRFYGTKVSEHVEAIYPILDWTGQDVVDYITDRGHPVHPLYYRADGSIDPKRRLGCMCCPLKGYRNRINEFKKYPRFVRLYCKYAKRYMDAHPDKSCSKYASVYEWFYRDVICRSTAEYEATKQPDLFGNYMDYKYELERMFGIDLTI